MDDFGGHNYEFIDAILDRYKCTVCTKVLRDPELTVCCGQHFCSSCLLQWFKSQHNKSCPHCRAEGSKFQHVENKSLKSEINQMKIACPNKQHGCEWTGEIGDLKAHLSGEAGCNFAEAQCTNKCGKKVLRSKMADHISTECKLRMESCQYCNKQDTFAAISKHKMVCPRFPLLCPNHCDIDAIPREKMPEHLKTCKLQKLECPFGCEVTLKPNELDKHLEKNVLQHLQMLAEANRDMKLKVEQTEKELHSIKEEHNKDKESIKSLKQSLIFELKALDGSESNGMQSAAYKSMQTQLEEEINILKKKDPTVFRMLDFSKLAQSSTTWYSPPFAIQHYKLCLAVHPRGLGSSFGSHASLSLILLEVGADPPSGGPTFNNLLGSIHILVPILKLGSGKYHRVYLSGVCGSSADLSPLKEGEDRRTIGTREEWISHDTASAALWNDSMVLKIEQENRDEGESFANMHAAMMVQQCRQS